MDKLDHLGWVVSRSFAIGGIRFAVRSTAPAFGGWLSGVLGAYEVEDVEDFLYSVVVPEPPGTRKTKELFILYKGSWGIVRTLDPVTLGTGVLAELEGLELHARNDAAFVTASLVDLPGGSVLVPPSIGARLATLGRRAEKLGIKGARRSATAIDIDTGSVIPIAPTLDVPGDALERLTAIFPWRGPEELPIQDAPDRIAAFLIPARDPEATLQPARKGFALANLAGWAINLERTGGAGLKALGRFVERTPCYESGSTDDAGVIALLSGLLERVS